jgi:hypothetical protein
MGVLAADGVRVTVGAGWDAQILRRTAGPPPVGHVTRVPPPRTGGVVVHVANFALPPEVGDFGGGVVPEMRASHILINLVEYDDASRGTALFAAQGMPTLGPRHFHPDTMQRTIRGQSGAQQFFSLDGRPFCLYVVLGSHLRRFRTGPVVNAALRGIEVG